VVAAAELLAVAAFDERELGPGNPKLRFRADGRTGGVIGPGVVDADGRSLLRRKAYVL
jgi:hypothetical protein